MSTIIPEKDLPKELTFEQAVEAAYSRELAEVASRLQRGMPSLIECEKEVAPFLFMNLRTRLRESNLRCRYIDGRPRENEAQGPVPMGLMGTMIAQIRDAVRGATERLVLVLPHLDLLTTSQGGLTGEAREVIVLLYENPELVWLGFKDPSFPLPEVISNLFSHRVSLLGIGRDRLRQLVTQKESRKFGKQFNPWALYKYVSGINSVRLRKLLASLEGEDYPVDPKQAFRQLRQATLTGTLEIPEVSLDKDIGGYEKVKKRLKQEILDVLNRRDGATDEEDVKRLEELIPRGMIFWGPPGTGKTFFAKAMASAIGAAITVVSGPELKSKWVGESLPYEEEVFVVLDGRPQRIAIGELVENHADADVTTWTVGDDGSAMLASVTGFLKHRGPDYIDVLTTETGREVRVTGGHSLFVEKNGTLAEVFAEQIEPGTTRIAVPLRLQAPETVRELNLLELLSGREDVRVQGYDAQLESIVGSIGFARANAATGLAVDQLTVQQRPPLTLASYERLLAEADAVPEPKKLSLYCWHQKKSLPAIVPVTEDLGEFLGIWTADGCYHRTGVRLAVHRDEADYFESLSKRLFGHVTRYCGKPGLGLDLILNSTLLKYLMRDGLGLKDGSATKRVPAFIFASPLPVIARFLRGYFSGDGTFTRKYIEATTVSRGLANDIVTLLQFFGIAARIRRKTERHGSPCYRIRFIWSKFLRIFADQIGFADQRRNQALQDYLNGMTFQRDLQTPKRHILNDVLWDRVVEKRREPYTREHVYDLSVPKTERFIAGFGNILVHNSEENLRQIFYRARQSAPSIIVFDELDSFASARGTYTGSGVEHSMVNQLLTEMDGFHNEELVFIVGTTNFVEVLDPALLRPGRFEFHLYIPYPEAEDRRAILKIYDAKMRLQMSEAALEYAVKRTEDGVEGAAEGTRYSGDHLNALCRSIARIRMRENRTGETTADDIEQALTEYNEKLTLTPKEEVLLSTHEAGHFVCALYCPLHPPPERITIQSERSWAPAYVKFQQDDSRRLGMTRKQMLDDLCVLFGGIEAERLLLDDISTGAGGSDLARATTLAHLIVEVYGMGSETTGLRQFRSPRDGKRIEGISPAQEEELDRQITALIKDAQDRAAKILRENREQLVTLRELLIEKKTLDAKTIGEMLAKPESKKTKKKPEGA